MNKIFKYGIMAATVAALAFTGGCADDTSAADYPNVVIDWSDGDQGYPNQNFGSLAPPKPTLLTIASGTADYLGTNEIKDMFKNGQYYHRGSYEGPVTNAFDGTDATWYHAPWGNDFDYGGYFPVQLDFVLDGTPETVEYISLIPRNPSGNGAIQQVELLVKCEGDTDFVSFGEKSGGSGPITFNFSPKINNPRELRLVVTQGYGGYVSLGEIECGVRHNPYTSDMDYFTDELCTELKPGVTREQAENITTPFFRNLALAMLEGTYDVENRVHDIKTYPMPEAKARLNKTAVYGVLDNATGMYVDWNDNVVIFVEDNLVADMTVRIVNPMKSYSPVQTVPLIPGINAFTAKEKGLMYIIYQDDAEITTKVHIATGKVNGVFDISKHKAEDWDALLGKASFTHFDVLGKHTHLIMTTVDLRAYVDDGMVLANAYDEICYMEQDFAGFTKYTVNGDLVDDTNRDEARLNKTRLCVMALNTPTLMFATDYYTGYSLSSLKDIIDVSVLRTTGCWGPAHELGHVNQIRPGFKWGGGSVDGDMTEVTNNMYSQYIQTEWGNRSRLLAENHYTSAFNRFFISEQPYAAGKGYNYCFEKLVPLWQLQLYFAKAKGYTDFYKDLLEAIRQDTGYDSWGNASAQQVNYCKNRFAVHASRIAETNLVKYFQDFRFELDENTTVKEINAMGYPEPAHELRYIHDENWPLFKSNAKVTEGHATVTYTDSEFKVFVNDDCRNATVIEVYIPTDSQRPILATTDRSFNVITSSPRIIIKAVGADGTRVELTQNNS